MNQLTLLLKLLRPHQWIKSGFVFVGLLFGHRDFNELLLEGRQDLLANVAQLHAAARNMRASRGSAAPAAEAWEEF